MNRRLPVFYGGFDSTHPIVLEPLIFGCQDPSIGSATPIPSSYLYVYIHTYCSVSGIPVDWRAQSSETSSVSSCRPNSVLLTLDGLSSAPPPHLDGSRRLRRRPRFPSTPTPRAHSHQGPPCLHHRGFQRHRPRPRPPRCRGGRPRLYPCS